MLNQKTGQTPIVKGLAIVTGIMSETSYKPCSLCVNSTNFVILLTGSVNDIKGDCINMANTNNNNTNKGNVITVENSKEVLSSQGLSSKHNCCEQWRYCVKLPYHCSTNNQGVHPQREKLVTC